MIRKTTALSLFLTLLGTSGCAKAPPAPVAAPAPVQDAAPVAKAPSARPALPSPEAREIPEIPSISLSSAPAKATSGNAATAATSTGNEEQHQRRETLLAAMMPLQVMLGQWHGTTQKEQGEFKALDQSTWVWDFQTERNQPAMVMKSEASPYIRLARLTYLIDRQIYQLKLTNPEGETRVLEGTFIAPAEEFQGDDQKMHVKYKLELTQVAPEGQRDALQMVFNQQENNRFLIELAKKRGSRFLRFDTIATQREGTSFAKSDAGVGNRECIISGGLGVMQVSYNGKSYWVCCSGCKAAFEEDPASWIADYERKHKAQGS
jgi:hypothetical protein